MTPRVRKIVFEDNLFMAKIIRTVILELSSAAPIFTRLTLFSRLTGQFLTLNLRGVNIVRNL